MGPEFALCVSNSQQGRHIRSKKSKNFETKDYIAKLLLDYFALNEINPDKEDKIPIWRIIIFEAEENSKIFHFVGLYHHALVQGHLPILNLYKILRTFELLHQNKPVEYKESKIYPGCEQLFNFKKDYESAPTLDPIKQPSFINKERAKAESIKLFDQNIPKDLDMNSELICVESQTRYDLISNLIKTCREHHLRQLSGFISNYLFIIINFVK